MPSILDFLAPYLAQMGGGGIMSPGQPVGGGNPMDRGELPGEYGMPEIRTTPVEQAGVEGAYGGAPMGPPPAAQEANPSPLAGVDSWKAQLPGLIGTAVSGLAGHLAGGYGLDAMAGFAGQYANVRHQQIQQKRQQEFETQKAVGDQAHKMWQELQGADLSKLPPNLSHLAQQKTEFDQKYAQAIAKDGISPKEAQELISIGSIIKSALPQVEKFRGMSEKAEPYTSAISAGAFEPPPGAEGIADLGLPNDEAANLAGVESFRGAELARQQYDTPQFDKRTGGMITPREGVTLRGQEMASQRAAAQQAAVEQRMLAQQQAQADAARLAEEGRDRRSDAQIAAQDRRTDLLMERFHGMPVPVQTRDEAGNPVTTYVPREQLMGEGANRSFLKAPSAAAIQKSKDAEVALQTVEELGRLYNPEYVGPGAGRYYALAEKFPDVGQIDELRSAFRAQNATIKNSMIKLITGAQMSQQEAERILKQVPEETLPPKAWKARYDQTVKNARILKDVNAGILDINEARKQMGLTSTGERGLQPPPGMPPQKPKSDPLGIF